jgi:glycosyltransferase involved in cell wall biosynthesis
LKTWIAAEGAEDNFEFVGYVPYSSLPDHYAWCDAFVGPSTYEPGPGNVYLEAMASARPVIACNTAGTPEVVRNGINGLLVAPGDAESLSGAILQIAGDHRLRDLLGSNGRGIVEREFSFERYIDKVEAIYLALVNENSK